MSTRVFPVGGPEWRAAPPPPKPAPRKSTELPPVELCAHCGAPFNQIDPTQKYCTKQHAHAAAKQRARRQKLGLLPEEPPAPPKRINLVPNPKDAMIEAARRAAATVGIMEPYGASIRDYIDADGKLDAEALHAADAEAEAENIRAWTVVIQAALKAAK